jgi:hypothetical protein
MCGKSCYAANAATIGAVLKRLAGVGPTKP